MDTADHPTAKDRAALWEIAKAQARALRQCRREVRQLARAYGIAEDYIADLTDERDELAARLRAAEDTADALTDQRQRAAGRGGRRGAA